MTKRTIISIDTAALIKTERYYSSIDGVRIVLSDGSTIEFGISDGVSCCESWDYLYSPDDTSEFIGAEYLGLEERDTWPDKVEVPRGVKSYFNEDELDFDAGGGFQAIDVKTSKGVMQFVVYNSHNGYYSHATILKYDGEVKESYL